MATSPVANSTPHSGHCFTSTGIQAWQFEHFAMSFSNSTPHFGHVVASSGMKAPHSPHSTILPSPKTFQYTVTPTAAATAAPRITKRSQYGRPRNGTCWERNGRVFFNVILGAAVAAAVEIGRAHV